MLMNKPRGNVYIYDWPTGSGKTFEVLNTILRGSSNKRSIRAMLDRTAIFTPSRAMKQAWLRDLGIYLLKKGIGLINPRSQRAIQTEDDWRKLSTAARLSILSELEILPKFWTFSEFRKRIRKPTNHGDCWHLVLDEWHRVGRRRKEEFLNIVEGKHVSNRWWNLYGSNQPNKRNLYLCSATPLNPVNESKIDEKQDLSEDSEESQLQDELQRAVGLIAVLSGRKETRKITRWKQLANSKIKLVDHPHKKSPIWKLPALPDLDQLNISPVLVSHLRKIRQKEVKIIADTIERQLPYTNEYRYCQGIIKTKYKHKKHWVSQRGTTSFGEPYEHTHRVSEKKKSMMADAWLINSNGRLIRLLALMLHFKVVSLKTRKNPNYPFTIVPDQEKVVIFCSHQATAKGLYYTLRKILPKNKSHAISTTFMRNKKENVRKANNEIIKQFNFDKNLKILIATDAFSESYDLHQMCRTVIHYEIPWSPHRLFQRVGRVTRLRKDGTSGKLLCNEGRVGHVIIPGSAEEEQIQRLNRRIRLLSEHQLLPGINLDDKEDHKSAFLRYLGIGPSWGIRQDQIKGKG